MTHKCLAVAVEEANLSNVSRRARGQKARD